MGAHAHPEITLHTPSLAGYVKLLDQGDLDGVGDLMLASAHALQRAGADFLICPDNTIHQAFAYVQPRSPLPWLHIAEVVASAALERGYRRLGLTGTHWLVDSDVYPEKLDVHGLECVKPSPHDRETMGRIIMDELVCGTIKADSVAALQSVVQRLKDQDCDAVILGCTELPLVLNDDNAALPTLDSTRLLARAALRRAVAA